MQNGNCHVLVRPCANEKSVVPSKNKMESQPNLSAGLSQSEQDAVKLLRETVAKSEAIIKALEKTTEKEEPALAPVEPVVLSNAVIRMEGQCPAGLLGCDAAKLQEATGGFLTCPATELAGYPLIIDGMGRVCWTAEDLKEEWRERYPEWKKWTGASINQLKQMTDAEIKRIMDTDQELIVQAFYAEVENLQSQGVSKAGILVVNAFQSNLYVQNFATRYGIPEADLVKTLTSWNAGLTSKLLYTVLDTKTPLFGQGVHQQLFDLIAAGAYLTAYSKVTTNQFYELVSNLGFLLEFGDQPAPDNLETIAINAVSFLPVAFRNALAPQAPVQQLVNFVVMYLVLGISQILGDKGVTIAATFASLKLAYDSLKSTRQYVDDLLAKKADAQTGLSTKDVFVSPVAEAEFKEAVKGKLAADRNYVSKCLNLVALLEKLPIDNATRLNFLSQQPAPLPAITGFVQDLADQTLGAYNFANFISKTNAYLY